MRQSAADKTNFLICILAMYLNPDLKSRTMPSSDGLYFRVYFSLQHCKDLSVKVYFMFIVLF